jgi:hypothetical protein
MAEEVKASEGYKEHHSALSKPATVVPVVAAVPKDAEIKKEEKAEAKEEKKDEKIEEKVEKKEEKKARKSRSASRKRNSIFGGFGLGSKKEEAAEAKETSPAVTTSTEAVAAPFDAQAIAAAAVAAPVVDESAKADAAVPATAETTRPAAAKRQSSLFGTLSSKFGQKRSVSDSKPSTDVAPAVPSKDVPVVAPVSAEAPVIPAPEASESLAAAVQSPATVPVTETVVPAAAAEEVKPEVKAETKAEAAQNKRKSSLPFGLGKLRQTIKGKNSPKAEKTSEKAAEKTEEPAAESTVETPAATKATDVTATEPVVSEPVPAVHQPVHQVSATA